MGIVYISGQYDIDMVRFVRRHSTVDMQNGSKNDPFVLNDVKFGFFYQCDFFMFVRNFVFILSV